MTKILSLVVAWHFSHSSWTKSLLWNIIPNTCQSGIKLTIRKSQFKNFNSKLSSPDRVNFHQNREYWSWANEMRWWTKFFVGEFHAFVSMFWSQMKLTQLRSIPRQKWPRQTHIVTYCSSVASLNNPLDSWKFEKFCKIFKNFWKFREIGRKI